MLNLGLATSITQSPGTFPVEPGMFLTSPSTYHNDFRCFSAISYHDVRLSPSRHGAANYGQAIFTGQRDRKITRAQHARAEDRPPLNAEYAHPCPKEQERSDANVAADLAR